MSKANKGLKICTLGDGRVGKTSIVNRWINNIFDPDQQSTVDAQMYLKKKVFVDGKPQEISLWDTAGQERYRALGNLYYRNADGAVLVYDCTDEDSLDRVRTWIKELQRAANPDLQIVICGNKCDRERERQVSEERGIKFAKKYQAQHFSTSAKANSGIDEAFLHLIRSVVAVKDGLLAGNGIDDLGNDDLFGNLTATDSSSPTDKKKKPGASSKKGGGRLKIVDDAADEENGGDGNNNKNKNNNSYDPAVSASGTRIGGSRVTAAHTADAGGDNWMPGSSSSSNNNNKDEDNEDSNPYGDNGGGYYSAYGGNNYKGGYGGDDDDDEGKNKNKKQGNSNNSNNSKKKTTNLYDDSHQDVEGDDEDENDDYGIDNDGSLSSAKKPVQKSTPATQAVAQVKSQQQQRDRPKTITLSEVPKKAGEKEQDKKCSC